MASLESASTRRASMPGFAPDDAHGPSGLSRCGGPGGIRASSPAGETGMSEPVGADLPVARDGEGQLSKEAMRSHAAGMRWNKRRLLTQDAVSTVVAVSAISSSRSANTSSE